VLRADLTIIEGVVGREGTGFQRGRNRNLGLVVAGTNVVAVDSVASWLVGFDPLKLIYLRMAAEAGLGENDPARITVYTTEGEELVPCADPAALRADPSFRVISGIKGEDLDPFREPASPAAAARDEQKNDPVLSIVHSWKEKLACHSTSANEAS
jgi:hypothetical protein